MLNPNSICPYIRGVRALAKPALFAALAGTMALGSLALAGTGQVTRTELYRSDLAGSDTTEVIVARLELSPGATVPRHSHNGDEHLVVLQGGVMTMPDGTPQEFPAGLAMDFPRDSVHGGLTATGDSPIVVLTVHFVDKGAPLNVAARQ